MSQDLATEVPSCSPQTCQTAGQPVVFIYNCISFLPPNNIALVKKIQFCIFRKQIRPWGGMLDHFKYKITITNWVLAMGIVGMLYICFPLNFTVLWHKHWSQFYRWGNWAFKVNLPKVPGLEFTVFWLQSQALNHYAELSNINFQL